MKPLIKVTKKGLLIGALFWIAWSSIFTVVLYLSEEDMPFLIAMLTSYVSYLPLFLLAIPIWYFPKMMPYQKGSRLAFFTIHILLAFLFSLVWILIYYGSHYLLWGSAVLEYIPVLKVGLFMYVQGLVFYGVFAGVFYSIYFQNELREKAVQTAKLESLSRQAELKALKSQINPHFLFNTLNTIYALADSNVNQAKKTITELSDLLRYSMAGFYREYIPLKEEVDMTGRYLDIEKSRFGDRLNVQYQVDEACLNYSVPPMLLQPLIENAVKHGIAPFKRGGTVTLSIQLENDSLHILVEDTGKGDKNIQSESENSGIGLQNLKQRLSHLYGDHYQFQAGPKEGRGFRVDVWLPVGNELIHNEGHEEK